MEQGPVVIGYDGSAAVEHAIREAAGLLAERTALIVVVWKEGLGFELMELPTATVGLPPAELDIRTAFEIDREMAERAQKLAQKGATIARDAGFEAEGLAVADDLDTPVADTLVEVAQQRHARAIVLGAHAHGHLGGMALGRISRDVILHAPCPAVIVRELNGSGDSP